MVIRFGTKVHIEETLCTGAEGMGVSQIWFRTKVHISKTLWTGTVGTWETMAWFGTGAVNSSTCDALFDSTSLGSLGSQKKGNSEVIFLREDTEDVMIGDGAAIRSEVTCWIGAVGIGVSETLSGQPTWSEMTCCTGGEAIVTSVTERAFGFHQNDLLYRLWRDWVCDDPVRFKRRQFRD